MFKKLEHRLSMLGDSMHILQESFTSLSVIIRNERKTLHFTYLDKYDQFIIEYRKP